MKGSGSEEKIVVLADEDYNELEIPLARFHGSKIDEGATVTLWKDDEEIVKVTVKH